MFLAFLYIVISDITDGWVKIGLTIHPVHRLCQYNTGDPPEEKFSKRFYAIWQVNAKTTAELRAFEKLCHRKFSAVRGRRASGANTEWFKISAEEVASFISAQHFIVRRVPAEEIADIHTKARHGRNVEGVQAKEEELLIQEKHDELALLEKFVKLIGHPLRKNQEELWDIFQELCIIGRDTLYRGIVQWPTGTGKTFAMLILFVLSAEKCKRDGTIFRGLLVAPQNNIFDTIIQHIRKLSVFGITICEGHNAQISSLHIPSTIPVLITVTHAALTDPHIMNKLPPITHCHYDEVHRIGGEEFFQLLQERLPVWKTEFLTGTSATPKTSNLGQHRKIAELFGQGNINIHTCAFDQAIQEGWIAKPRFRIDVMPRQTRDLVISGFLQCISTAIHAKISQGNWQGGKIILYFPRREEVRAAILAAPSEWTLYSAVEGCGTSDQDFVSDPADGSIRILFACERYREGSDIKGLEMTGILMGDTISAHTLIQIVGRALRNDYEGKEGWCCIFRPTDETAEDVWGKIMLEIADIVGDHMNQKEISKMVETFLGRVIVSGKEFTVEETIQRTQALYERRAWERGEMRYANLLQRVREEGISSESQYHSVKSVKGWPDDPTIITGFWSWFDLLKPGAAANTDRPCLDDFKLQVMMAGIVNLEEYIQTTFPPWEHLLEGYLRDRPNPLPSFLEAELFQGGRAFRA